MSLVLGGFDVVGDEDEGVTILGRGGRRPHGLAKRGGKIRVPTPKWMNAATSQGVSRPQEDMDPLPFEPATLANTAEGVVQNVAGFLLARPQRPFRGERLIMAATYLSDGSDASAAVVIDPAIFVGAVQVGATQGATPLVTYSASAFGVRLSVPAAGQGTDIKIFVRALAIPGDDSIVVTATLIGRAMR
jgi:hypothetical protein